MTTKAKRTGRKKPAMTNDCFRLPESLAKRVNRSKEKHGDTKGWIYEREVRLGRGEEEE